MTEKDVVHIMHRHMQSICRSSQMKAAATKRQRDTEIDKSTSHATRISNCKTLHV